MKRLKFFLPIVVAMIGVVLFSQCKKDHSCNMRITCNYSPNGMDAGDAVPFAIITFDTSKYHNGEIDTLISRVNVKGNINEWAIDSLYRWSQTTNYKYIANDRGVFEYTLPYPALLIVNAINVEAIKDTFGNILEYVKYTGTMQVQVDEGETTEKTLLMVETN